jgi:hypothetical protein
MDRAKEIEKILNSQDTWDMDLLEEICELAGLSDEWKAADGESFESVAYKAASILNINI